MLPILFGVLQSSASKPNVWILVNKATTTLTVYADDKPLRTYPVCTGFADSTPVGRFRIVEKTFVDNSGRSPFGTRWMGLNKIGHHGRRIGIHGTNAPETIGKHRSDGCVRMRNADVDALFEEVGIGTVVKLEDVPPGQKSK
jgi:lipoprotein-anchoring transpeptidase ErfK/SrfK